MMLSLETLKSGGSCYTVVEEEIGFSIHLSNDDRANFNIIARRLIDEAGLDYVVFPRSDGDGGYDCVHIIPH